MFINIVPTMKNTSQIQYFIKVVAKSWLSLTKCQLKLIESSLNGVKSLADSKSGLSFALKLTGQKLRAK